MRKLNSELGYILLTICLSFLTLPIYSQQVRIKYNTGSGDPMIHIISPGKNSFIGDSSGINNAGTFNVSLGYKTLVSNIQGNKNTGIGTEALRGNTTGIVNTSAGYKSMYSNTTGGYNCGYGGESLFSNTTGSQNTAIGNFSLFSNLDGFQNTAIGYGAMYHNSSGFLNTAVGHNALFFTTSGYRNVAIGQGAILNNTTGESNTAIGNDALYLNSTGSFNTCVGREATCGVGDNPSNFTALGYGAGHVNSNNNSVEIGNTSITWIGGQKPWSQYSDSRIKDNVQSDVPGLSFINKLRPVTYQLNVHRQNEICNIADTIQWEGKYDIETERQSGFIAQEVEAAAHAVNYSFSGIFAPYNNAKLYSISYSSFVVPLTKAVQELSEENNVLKSEINNLNAENNSIQAELIELRSIMELIIASQKSSQE